jgi:hypothetical protein
MTYNLVKTSVPPLVDKNFLMKIAKMNNVDYITGKSLPEPPKPPSQFELLCIDLKESFFSFIRANILLIVTVILISIFLVYRYYQVKKRKVFELENENKIKKILEQKLEQKLEQELLIKQQQNNVKKENDDDKKKKELEMELLRTSFNGYDDMNIKNLIMNNRLNNQMPLLPYNNYPNYN